MGRRLFSKWWAANQNEKSIFFGLKANRAPPLIGTRRGSCMIRRWTGAITLSLHTAFFTNNWMSQNANRLVPEAGCLEANIECMFAPDPNS
jgi:hypothetical protein